MSSNTSAGVSHIILGITKICPLLLPEKENPKLLHQWRELIRNRLQRLGTLSQRTQQLTIGLPHLLRRQRAEHASPDPG